MASTPSKRPLPALVSLLALLLLTALVWWRVLNRGDGASGPSCPGPTATAAALSVLPAPSSITVQVLNSTDRGGIATKARTTLVSDGFQAPHLAANDSPAAKIPGPAEIRYGPDAAKKAAVLLYYFPGAKLVRTSSTSPVVVVSLGDKYREVASQSAVQAALAAHHAKFADDSGASPASASPSC